MTYMTEAPQVDQSVAAQGVMAGGHDLSASGTYRLRRHGARPIVFSGTELGMAMSFTPDIPYWFEVNLYRATDGTFAVAVKQFFQSADETDLSRAWTAPTLEEACASLEQYDPAQDVPVKEGFFEASMSAAEMQSAAFALRAQVVDVRTHYRSLLGEFFYGMEHA
ncbi:MAG: hypothetical protein AAGB05_10845 [Pseudomonadota bacterium]